MAKTSQRTVRIGNGAPLEPPSAGLSDKVILKELGSVLTGVASAAYHGHVHVDVAVQAGRFRKLEIEVSRVWKPEDIARRG